MNTVHDSSQILQQLPFKQSFYLLIWWEVLCSSSLQRGVDLEVAALPLSHLLFWLKPWSLTVQSTWKRLPSRQRCLVIDVTHNSFPKPVHCSSTQRYTRAEEAVNTTDIHASLILPKLCKFRNQTYPPLLGWEIRVALRVIPLPVAPFPQQQLTLLSFSWPSEARGFGTGVCLLSLGLEKWVC